MSVKPNNSSLTEKYILFFAMLLLPALTSCGESSHQEMIRILQEESKRNFSNANINSPEAQLAYADSDMLTLTSQGDINFANYLKASLLVKVGQEQKAVAIYENLLDRMDPAVSAQMLPEAAIAQCH